MKRRTFLKNSAVAAGAASLAIPALGSNAEGIHEKSLFELRIYQVSRVANAKNLLIQYFKDALVPFLGKHGAKLVAFNAYSLEEPAELYVLLAYPNPAAYFTVQNEWNSDPAFLEASGSYHAIPASGAVYNRFESFLMEAFDKMPKLTDITGEKQLFELRIYESANEDAGRRKIAMFNNEEIDLFLKVGLQPVFFGRILAGQYMPGLIYMVGFKDMADRDAVWSKFGAHEDWNTMRVKPEYADTVSNIRRIFLTPA